MRVRKSAAVAAVVAAAGWAALTGDPLQGQTLVVSQVLADARAALGGEKRLSAVKTFVATGRTRQRRGNNLVPIEFEISCELPDKFVRTDEFPAQDTDPTTSGFRGDALIQVPPLSAGSGRGAPPPADRGGAPPGGGRGGPPPLSPAEQRVIAVKQEFARLTLGLFATSFSSFPLTFTYLAQGEAPQGKADILAVAGPASFSAQLVIERTTHLPVMVIWQVPATTVMLRIPGQPPPDPVPPGALVVDAPPPPAATASQDERTAYATTVATLRRQALAQAKPVEYRIYYADYRDIDGLKWPFRLRRAIAGETVEETTFDRFRLNTKIDARKFEAPK